MQTFKTLPDAIALAEFAHRNQVDKAGLPYIDHPKRVLASIQAMGAPPFVQIAAVFHDITEDTAFTPEILLSLGFSEAAVRLVKLVDRHESRAAWAAERVGWGIDINNKADCDLYYYSNIIKDEWARKIKLADITDNTLPWRLSYLEPETQERLKAKYAKALEILNS